jgi:hypothetical protein
MARKQKKTVTVEDTVTGRTEEVTPQQIAQAAIETPGRLEEINETEVETPDPKLTVTARCEQAKEVSCSCRCRGKYHAKPHPNDWKLEEGCEPLSPAERKIAKRESLNAWRRAHPDRVSAYMKAWRETSESATAQHLRAGHQKAVEKQELKAATAIVEAE